MALRDNLKSEKAKERYDRNFNSVETTFSQKELEEHDKEIRNKAIDDFFEELKKYEESDGWLRLKMSSVYEIAEEMRGAE